MHITKVIPLSADDVSCALLRAFCHLLCQGSAALHWTDGIYNAFRRDTPLTKMVLENKDQTAVGNSTSSADDDGRQGGDGTVQVAGVGGLLHALRLGRAQLAQAGCGHLQPLLLQLLHRQRLLTPCDGAYLSRPAPKSCGSLTTCLF